MNFIDYTCKLNNHEEYVKILNLLENKTDYIEVVLIDGRETNDLVEKFKDDIIFTKVVSKWWGTETITKNKLVKIKSSKKLFDYLYSLETFVIYYYDENNKEHFKLTNFGYDDIAFYDKNQVMLLCTTTHEGYIEVNKILFDDNDQV